MAKKKAAKATKLKTIAAVAERLGVDERTVKTWLARGCPGETGSYDVDAIAAWRAAHRKAPAAADAERAKWAASREKAQAKREWLRLRRDRGDLILVSRAAQIYRQVTAEVITHLDQLPEFAVAGSRLPADAKKKLKEKLRGKVSDMRAALEKSIRTLAATAKRDGEAESDE